MRIRARKAFLNFALLVLGLFTSLATASLARASDYQQQVVPEFDLFIKFSDLSRLYLFTDASRNITDNFTNGDLGVNLDITLKPLLMDRIRDADWKSDRYLWTRIGYLLAGSIDGRSNGFTDHRLIWELTGRAVLPEKIWLVNRVRADWRNLNGVFCQFYRLRLGIEKEFVVADMLMLPYAQAEVFYDTRYTAWNRWVYQVGDEITLAKEWRIELYFSAQVDKNPSPSRLDTLGIVLKLYI